MKFLILTCIFAFAIGIMKRVQFFLGQSAEVNQEWQRQRLVPLKLNVSSKVQIKMQSWLAWHEQQHV